MVESFGLFKDQISLIGLSLGCITKKKGKIERKEKKKKRLPSKWSQ